MQSATVLHPFMEEATNGKLTALPECLDSLKGEQKSCVQLFYFEGKSYQEITKEKDLSLGKVRSFIQNGRRNLKICIERAEAALKREE